MARLVSDTFIKEYLGMSGTDISFDIYIEGGQSRLANDINISVFEARSSMDWFPANRLSYSSSPGQAPSVLALSGLYVSNVKVYTSPNASKDDLYEVESGFDIDGDRGLVFYDRIATSTQGYIAVSFDSGLEVVGGEFVSVPAQLQEMCALATALHRDSVNTRSVLAKATKHSIANTYNVMIRNHLLRKGKVLPFRYEDV